MSKSFKLNDFRRLRIELAKVVLDLEALEFDKNIVIPGPTIINLENIFRDLKNREPLKWIDK